MAYPILRKHNGPATIFLTSGFIGTDRAPWVDEIAYALSNSTVQSFTLPKLFGNTTISISNHEEKAKTLHDIYLKLLYFDQDEKKKTICELLEILSASERSRGSGNRQMLTWNEVREMSQNRISFGAHTMTHPTLSKLPLEDAIREIR